MAHQEEVLQDSHQGEALEDVSANGTSPTEVERGVKSIFDELGIKLVEIGDRIWTLDTKGGELTAALDDAQEILSVFQLALTLKRPPRKCGQLLYGLMCANMGSTGAFFCCDDEPADGGQPEIWILARIAATELDRAEVEQTLSSIGELGGVIDKAWGS